MQVFKKLFTFLSAVLISGQAFGQASLLPNAKQQFFSDTGVPLASGTVDLYVPNTTTRKNSWVNSTESSLNTNPVVLDSAGRALIYGQGSYRQIVKDSDGNQIWDGATAAPSSGTSVFLTDAAPVGTMLPYGGLTLPTNYLWAGGQAVSRTTYSSLLSAITLSESVTATASSTTVSGFSDTSQFKVGAPIEGTCLSGGTTIATIAGSTSITVSAVATATGACIVRVFPFGNGDGTTTFNVPDMRGRTPAGRDNINGSAASVLTNTYCTASGALGLGSTCGAQSHTMTTAEMVSHTHVLTDPGHTHGFANTIAGTNGAAAGYLVIGGTSQSTASATTGITMANTGSTTAFSIVQPTTVVNYVIKYQASDPTGNGGVISIGGMTGDILCGTNLTCSGGTISATGGGSGTPGGSNTQCQYNNVGSFGGVTGCTTNGTVITLTSPVFVTPALGTPVSGVLTNATGLPFSTGLSGTLSIAQIGASGSPSSANFLRGDGTWSTPSGAGTVTSVATTSPIGGGTITGAGTITCTTCVTSAASLTANKVVIGAGSQATSVVSSAGTATTVLHDGSPPSFSAVVSGDLNITATSCSATQFVSAISSSGIGTCSVAGGGVTGLASPTASIGLSVVNGSATTAMRSDAAPALDQSIAPTWTGQHIHSISNAAAVAIGPNGNTNPTLRVVTNTASGNNGLSVTNTNGAGVNVAVISGSTNDNLNIDAKGSGTLTLNNTATGSVFFGRQARANVSNTTNPGYAGVSNLSGIDVGTVGRVSVIAASTEQLRSDSTTGLTALTNFTAQSIFNSNVTRTIASANLQAGTASWNDVEILGSTTTLSGSTNISSFSLSKNQFDAPVLTASAAAVAVTQAQTVYIAGAPTTSNSGGFTPTIANPWALWLQSGAAHFGANVDFVGAIGVGTTSSLSGTKWIGIAAGATGYSQINFAASTAPTSPNDGDLWFETGSCLKLRVSGSNTSLCGSGSGSGGQYTGGSLGGVITASATSYVGPSDGISSNAASATEIDHQSAVTRNGTAKNLTVSTRAAQSGTGALVVTVRKNGVDTALTLTISAGAAAGVFSDTTHTVSFTQLDLISVKLANAASATGPGISFAIEYD